MKRDQRAEVLRALKRLTDAAEEFVNHTPRLQRTGADRQVLLDAITGAQLVLSVHRLPSEELIQDIQQARLQDRQQVKSKSAKRKSTTR